MFQEHWVWKGQEKFPQVFYCRLVFPLAILILQPCFIWFYDSSSISMNSRMISRLSLGKKKICWLIDLYITIAFKCHPPHAPTSGFVTKVWMIILN